MSKFGICSPLVFTDFRSDCERESIIRNIIQNSLQNEERDSAMRLTDSDFFKLYSDKVREYERNFAANFGKCLTLTP